MTAKAIPTSPIVKTAEQIKANTTGFNPALPLDTIWKTKKLEPATFIQRLKAEATMYLCMILWFSPPLSTFLFVYLLLKGRYIAFTLLALAAAYPYIVKHKQSAGFRFLLLKMWDPYNVISKFRITYAHGSWEMLNRHSRADYLDYQMVSGVPPTPSPTETVYPASPLTEKLQQAHGNDLTSHNSPEAQEILKKPVMIVGSPHGIYCVGFHFGGIGNLSLDSINSKIRWLVAPNLLVSPFFEYITTFYNKLRSASADSMKQLMQRGDDLALCVGGFNEATAYEYGKCTAYLRKRTGFIKYALQFGYNIIPMYSFGEEMCYYNVKGGQSWRQWLADRNIPTIMAIGKWGGFMPFADVQVDVVYGKPFILPRIENPSREEVDYWHGQYIQRVQELFDEFKGESGRPDAKLHIL